MRRDKPIHVVLDSAGLQMFSQGEWDGEKHGRTPRQWRKLHLAVNRATGKIAAHVLTDPDAGDITTVPSLLATVEGPIASVIADSAYDDGSVYKVALLRQRDPPADVVISPRASSVLNDNKAATSTVRDRHVSGHRRERPQGLADGHRLWTPQPLGDRDRPLQARHRSEAANQVS